MKKFIPILSAATIALSSIGGTVAYGSVFADINNVPWSGAAQYIDEAYTLGLMAGYVENGSRYCKAKNNVTYCEAVQLMYSIMSSYSGTSVSSSVVSKWTSTMASNNIPTWAYNSIAYALENSILSTNDLSIFMSSSGTQNNARREDVAVIFGKALAKVYSVASNPTISYNDKASVSTTSVPYIELLNRLEIMVGDSSNNFNPKVNINRAEMAVLSSKAYNKLKNGGSTTGGTTGQIIQYAGTVQSKTSNGSGYTISLAGKTGGVSVTYTFTTDSSTSVITGSSTSTVAKLNTGDTVVAICNGTVASTIIVTATGSTATTTKSGTISALTTTKISLKSGSTTTDYNINDSSAVTVTIDGSTSSFSTLKSRFTGGTDYTATITIDSNGYVTKIAAKSGDDDEIVSRISSSYILLKNGDKYYFVDDEDELIIKLASGTSLKTLDGVDELQEYFDDMDDDEYMTVVLTLDDDEITKVVATIESEDDSSSTSVSGVISYISESYVKIDGTKYYFPSNDDDVTMKFDGTSKSTISSFVDKVDTAMEDDQSVYAEIKMEDDEIYRIYATPGETKSGELKSIDTDAKEIEIGTKTYDYTSSTTFEITDGNSSITSASKLEKAIDDDDKTVEVTLLINADDEVVSVTGEVTEVEGTIRTYKYSSTDTSCYITIDNSTDTTKYYFTRSTDFTGDCDDTEDLDNVVNEDEQDVDVVISLEDGKITDIECTY